MPRKLLAFMRSEVENEELYNLAAKGFKGLTMSENEGQQREKSEKFKDNRRKQQQQQPSPKVLTASVLLATEKRREIYIFCKGKHENADCEKVRKIPLEMRKNIFRNKDCFRCLKFQHRSSACKTKI